MTNSQFNAKHSHKQATRQSMLSMLLLLCASLLSSEVVAQEGSTGYQFLDIPSSAHSAALGGNNISVIEDDATMMFANPALMVNVSDNTLNLNFTSYVASTSKLGAAFVKQTGERGAWAVGAQMLNYGTMTETDRDFNTIGSFSAKDIAVQGGYSYLFSDRWSGGVQGKVLMSSYGEFSSTALAVDLGLNYYDEERGLSFGLVAQNLGAQVDALYETTEKLPVNVAVGLSKDFENAPIRISLTFDKLTDWSSKKPINHMAIGADIFPSRNTWVAVGINPRRQNEMQIMKKSHGAGLSLGAGLNLSKFKVGLAWAKYHVAASSLVINTSYSF